MRLGKCVVKNFQSFEHLEFDFSAQGLTLIAGPTKAGKSTLLDTAPWILFGTTSKDSAADDVRSWFATEPTMGTLEVTLGNDSFTITRIRGSAKQNDLYIEDATGLVRGKDLTETQKLISQRLGVDADLFIEASYMHQFSKADQFFIAKAKDRRDTLEKIADLSLPVMLAEKTSEARKLAKKSLEIKSLARTKLEGKVGQLGESLDDLVSSDIAWELAHKEKLSDLKDKAEHFEEDKRERAYALTSKIEATAKMLREPEEILALLNNVSDQLKRIKETEVVLNKQLRERDQIAARLQNVANEYNSLNALDDVCPTCLGESNNAHRAKRLDEIELIVSDLEAQLIAMDQHIGLLQSAIEAKDRLTSAQEKHTMDNIHNMRLRDKALADRAALNLIQSERNFYAEQVAEATLESSPWTLRLAETQAKLEKAQAELAKAQDDELAQEVELSRLNWLYDKSFELRGRLLSQAVRSINDHTNMILERFFDAELRIRLELTDGDKLEVSITNGGYDCPFRQLSGGERCMLKLAFNFAYMRAAEDRVGIKFSTLMLDESLNGLDATLKVKVFTLLQSMEQSYETILVIDHSEELKVLFQNQYVVDKASTHSSLSKVELD